MVWDAAATLHQLQATLTSTGVFLGGVQIGEPFSPPLDLLAAVFLMEWNPIQTTLDTTIDTWTIGVRIYSRAGMTPPDAERAELGLVRGMVAVAAALAGDYTLGGTVRAIDWAGEEAGYRTSARWGHLDVGGTLFRIADALVPVITDDSAAFAP